MNIFAIDLSKAYVNHHAPFIKIMKRHIPVTVVGNVIENFFHGCLYIVMSNGIMSGHL